MIEHLKMSGMIIAEIQETFGFITYKCWYYDTAAEAGTCEVPRTMSEEGTPPEIANILRKRSVQSRH